MSYLPSDLTPAKLRDIAAMLRIAKDAGHFSDPIIGAAQDLEKWAAMFEQPPASAITWISVGDGETVAIEESTNRVLGSISQGVAGTLKYWKWSAWDQMYNTMEAARAAFEKHV